MGASTQHKPAHLNMLSARIARPAVRALSSTTPAGTIRSKHTLPKLPYSYDALEPAISAEIMELHHSKHHQTYVNGLNAAEEELKTAVQASDVKKAIELQRAINFNGGGHINHTLFWENLAPTKNGGGKLNDGKLDELISRDFGSVDELKKRMNAAAAGIQGSGWAWRGSGDEEARPLHHRQPGPSAHHDPASRHRHVGARVLPSAPEQEARLPREHLEGHEL